MNQAPMAKIVMVFAFLCGIAQAAPTARQLERVLGGYERAATADELRRLGPGIDQALIGYAADPRTSPAQRLKAIVALRHTPSEAARAFLLALLDEKGRATEGGEVVDASAALGALSPYGPALLPVVLPYLTHAAADLRQSAAATLGQLGATDAVGPLRARLTVERDVGVRLVLGRALRALADSPSR